MHLIFWNKGSSEHWEVITVIDLHQLHMDDNGHGDGTVWVKMLPMMPSCWWS